MNFPFHGARWIGCPDCPADASPVFRKTFQWSKGASGAATLYISGLGFYTLRLNGGAVNDEMLNPAFSRYDQTVYYNEIPLDAFLREGENVLEVALGNGWYNQQQEDAWQFEHAVWKGAPRLICALYAGETCVLASGSDWQAASGATTFNSLRCGETFDARVQPQWGRAAVVPPPGGALKRQEIEPIRLRRYIDPVGVVPSEQPVVYDFGVNLSGNVEICVEGPCGAKVTIVYSEIVMPNGYLAREQHQQFVYFPRFQQDEYILAGQGQETWHSRFGYNGFRYAMVRAPRECRVLRVRARQFHTDLQEAGGISTGDASLCRIQAAIRQSSLTNFHHMPTDCPHREKNGWTGDAWLSARQMLFNFDMRKAYIKWLDDIVDCQRPGGQIPCIAPTSAWGYAWGSGITWDVALLAIPWEMYWFYGDAAILRRYAQPVQKYMQYLRDTLDHGIPPYGLGDWCAPPEADLIPEAALRACMAVYAGQLAEQMGCALADDALRELGEGVARECKSAFLREYGAMAGESLCQLYYALRLLLGLSDGPEEDLRGLLRSLDAAQGHIMGGIFTARFVPEALTRFGRPDAAWKLASAKGYPGWDDLANKCAGTLGESWFGGSSMNHHMFSSIGAWYYQALAGMRALEPGFAKVLLAPYIPQDLPQFSAWHQTPRGKLLLEWDEARVTVEIPAGVAATVRAQKAQWDVGAGRHSFSRRDFEAQE